MVMHPNPNPSPNPNPHQVLGDLELIDQGELDHKIIAIDAADPMAAKINSIADLKVLPSVVLGVGRVRG